MGSRIGYFVIFMLVLFNYFKITSEQETQNDLQRMTTFRRLQVPLVVFTKINLLHMAAVHEELKVSSIFLILVQYVITKPAGEGYVLIEVVTGMKCLLKYYVSKLVSTIGVSLQLACELLYTENEHFVITCAEVMNISEGTVVAAPKVGRPRKAVVIAPGGTLQDLSNRL